MTARRGATGLVVNDSIRKGKADIDEMKSGNRYLKICEQKVAAASSSIGGHLANTSTS
jgi:hypothetical protein